MKSDSMRAASYWNSNYPIGQPVTVRRDNGETLETVTRSEAWTFDGIHAVIQVKGISGCYMLDRVTPREVVNA